MYIHKYIHIQPYIGHAIQGRVIINIYIYIYMYVCTYVINTQTHINIYAHINT